MDWAAPAVILLFGVIFLGVGIFGKKLRITEVLREVFGIAGFIAMVIGVLMITGVWDSYFQPAAVAEEEPMYEITVSESMSWVTYDSDNYKFTLAMSFNDTSDAFVGATNYLQANFTILRADALDDDFITSANLVSVGVVDVTGAADEYICDEAADGNHEFVWSKLGGVSADEDITVKVEAGDSNWVLLNVTLNADAVENMATYESSSIFFTVAGYNFEIVAIKAVVVT